MPIAAEAWFISPAKASIEPETPSAIVTAMSLADLTMSMTSALRSVTSCPARKPIFDGACSVARSETTSGVSSVMRPLRTASSAT